MNLQRFAGLLTASLPLLLAAHSPDGWSQLFDGQSLSGWTFDVLDNSDPAAIWSVRDGIIHVAGRDHPKSVLRSEKSYANYELQFEWRWPGEPGNSGCLVHCSTPRKRNVWPKSLEVQLLDGKAGDFIFIGESVEVKPEQVAVPPSPKHWSAGLRHNLTDDSENPAGQWNYMRLVVKGKTIEVYVNGALVNKGWNGSASEGAICLQAEEADIQFRNIRLRQLSTQQRGESSR
jgi:hypothetical protein